MRYQNFTERTQRLHQAALEGGWVLNNLTPTESHPIWVATHPNPITPRSRVAWAMMHGNEPTGFEALIQFIRCGAPTFNWTLIPMVNPTGIDSFSRLTAGGVDLNRCARQDGPFESDALKAVLKGSNYELALNLHDQRSIFRPLSAHLPSSLSVLAPAALSEGLPSQPERALAWAGSLSIWMRESRPNWGYSRFDESYYPTAFGEWVQELGIPTVTVETGIAPGDAARAEVGQALFKVICRVDLQDLPDDYGVSHYRGLPVNSPDGCDFAIQCGTRVLHWKLWEHVQEGRYISGIERIEMGTVCIPYQRIEVANADFDLLMQRPIWTATELYATGISALRDLAAVLPR
jgi:hypothetical protein